MIIINTVSSDYFTLNGVQYAKIYQPLKQGNENISINNIFDVKQKLFNSEKFDEIQVNSVVFASQALLIAALLPVVFNAVGEISLSGRPFVDSETGDVDILGGILRNTSGTWDFINDSNHYGKSGFSSVSQASSGTVTLNYNENYEKVISLVVTPDETYAEKGIFVGASVGLGFSNIKLYENKTIGDYVYFDGSVWRSLEGVFELSYSSGELILTHEDVGYNSIASVCDRDSSSYIARLGSIGGTSTMVKFYNFDGTQYTGGSNSNMKFFVTRTSRRQINNTNSAVVGSNIWVMGMMQKS